MLPFLPPADYRGLAWASQESSGVCRANPLKQKKQQAFLLWKACGRLKDGCGNGIADI
jgi:hypothetical protein